ncbi:MAG: hypothetical protein A2X84_06180 [Desulfuromonadaceae bacterium GWC2_58_13]|nr:MAG: hypothetical protein A2X84_06180 [Desulfuromonadaceae bacterium GWC2_58_13]
MPPSSNEISNFLEKFQKSSNAQNLHVKFRRLFMELKSILPKEQMIQIEPLSVETTYNFLSRFNSADKKGKAQRAENPPSLIFWNALGFSKDEVTNCRIISWLLDPKADHCQENKFFSCLLQLEQLKSISNYATQNIYVTREEWLNENNRADIVIHGSRFVIVIEVKIDAPERTNQREDYQSIMEICYPFKKFVGIYLCKKSQINDSGSWLNIRWDDVVEVIDVFTSKNNDSSCRSQFVTELIRQYGKYIINNIINK